MIAKTIKYVDYNGNERTETLYFNLSKSEVAEMEFEVKGGFSEMLKTIVDNNDTAEIMKTFKTIILKAYGIKSEDGRRFIKSDELSNEFYQTEAYSELFMELATDADKMAEFVNGIIAFKVD